IEVGGPDPDPGSSEVENGLERTSGHVQLDLSRGVDDTQYDVACPGWRFGDPPVAVHLTAGVPPVGEESCPQTVDHRATQLEVGFPPLRRVTGITFPFRGHPDSAREGHLVVDDQDLAVGSVVDRKSTRLNSSHVKISY